MEPIDFTGVIEALLANALREAEAGPATAVSVEVGDDAVRVVDDGRGLPVHAHPGSGRPLVEVILTGPRRGPRNTLARVNACSLWLEVESQRDGELFVQRYELARPTSEPRRRGAAVRRGTAITAAPALGAPPDFEGLRALVRRVLEARAPGLRVKVRLRDLRCAKDETIVVV